MNNFIGILNLRGGIPNKMGGEEGGGRRRDSVLKGERFGVEVKSFLKVIFCTTTTSSFIKPIEIDKVLKKRKRTFLRLETPAPYFYFPHI